MNDLKEIDWNQALKKQDIDSAVNDWNNLFTHVADSHAPMRKSRIKGVRSPLINAQLSKAMHSSSDCSRSWSTRV